MLSIPDGGSSHSFEHYFFALTTTFTGTNGDCFFLFFMQGGLFLSLLYTVRNKGDLVDSFVHGDRISTNIILLIKFRY